MWCLTAEESKAWHVGYGFVLDPLGSHPQHDSSSEIVVPLSPLNWSRLTWLSKFVATSFGGFDECLLWVTLWGVWSSSENWHLFYRLREGYGERRLLHDAPGHLFLKHEVPDLATIIELAFLFGWDFHLSPAPLTVSAFVSHDEFLHFYAEREKALTEIKQGLTGAKIEFEERSGAGDTR